MIRTQIQLEERQYQRLRQLAHSNRVSLAETVRRLLDQQLGLAAEGEDRCGPRALLDIAGIGRSGLGDLGRNHDHWLAEDPD
jgi:hypothetical protein